MIALIDWRDCIVPVKHFKRGQIYLWVAYDKKPPYLPLAVAESARELGKIVGKSESKILSRWYEYQRGRTKKSAYHKVKVGMMEDGDADS